MVFKNFIFFHFLIWLSIDSSVDEDWVVVWFSVEGFVFKICSILDSCFSALLSIEPGSGIVSKSGGCVKGSFFLLKTHL